MTELFKKLNSMIEGKDPEIIELAKVILARSKKELNEFEVCVLWAKLATAYDRIQPAFYDETYYENKEKMEYCRSVAIQAISRGKKTLNRYEKLINLFIESVSEEDIVKYQDSFTSDSLNIFKGFRVLYEVEDLFAKTKSLHEIFRVDKNSREENLKIFGTTERKSILGEKLKLLKSKN